MWNWFNCYLSGRHDYGVWCEPGAIFLRCTHCGRRSSGWAITEKVAAATTATVTQARQPAGRAQVSTETPLAATRVVPFSRAAAR